MNELPWSIRYVNESDESLIDLYGMKRLATTDPIRREISISNKLYGNLLVTVFLHELGHCVLFSYNLLPAIQRMVKEEYWLDMEEWICNFIVDYGIKIFKIGYDILGEEVWKFIIQNIERMMG